MLLSVDVPSEVVGRELVRVIGLARSWNERDGLHPLEHALVGRGVPMVIRRIRLQKLLVARFSDRSKDTPFFGGFYVGAVAVVSRQIIVDHMAHLVERRCLEQNIRLF